MKRSRKVTLARVMRAVRNDHMVGFCLACGAERDSVEPDARKYRCEQCEQLEVYGAEEILMMGAAS